ncbi:MAG: alpha/beta hydrolase [Gemmatimonadaceae bacterium]
MRTARIATAPALVAALLSTACAHVAPAVDVRPAGPSSWMDSRGFLNQRVQVSDTWVHVVDYGGVGEPLVFLAGLGNSAHVFDDFAPRFTDRFHVLALTRRGYGESGRPASGFGTARLAQDVADVLDTLQLERAVLAGHSVAGDELTELGVHHPRRVRALVYLDAAYDRQGFTGRTMERLLLGQLPPSMPRPSARDRSSVREYAGYLERIYGVPWPESEVRATRRFDSGGAYVGDANSGMVNLAVARGELPMLYERITAPTLAIYAVERRVERDYPWIQRMTIGQGKARLQAQKAQRAEERWEADGRKHLANALPSARIVKLSDASHYLFISHADTVEAEMRAFLQAERRPRAEH